MNSAVGQQSAGLRNFRMFADSALAADKTVPFATLIALIENCFFMAIDCYGKVMRLFALSFCLIDNTKVSHTHRALNRRKVSLIR